MTTPGLVRLAICGLAAAAAASAFVAPPSRLARSRPPDGSGPLGSAAERGAETSRRRPKEIVPPIPKKEEGDGDGLRRDQFVADIEQSVDEMESMTFTLPIRWRFRGRHDVHCMVSRPATRLPASAAAAKKLPAVLLVHGLGCSTVYWRKTVASLTREGYEVYAMDLLGQGLSAKPTDDEGVTYSTRLWARQVDDFCREVLPHREGVVLVGNSVGSVVALLAAAGELATEEGEGEEAARNGCYIKERIAGIGMFNCGIGLNVHSITRDPKWNPVQRFLLNANFEFMEQFVFGNVGLMRWILDNVATKDILRNVLLQLYPCAKSAEEVVDDELVESFYAPAKDPDAPEVLSQILTNDAGPTPMEVHSKHGAFLNELPIHVVWGDADAVTPVDGIGEVGQHYAALSEAEGNRVTMEVVRGGHVPFDEVPSANESMVRWLNDVVVGREGPARSRGEGDDAHCE